MGFFTRKPTREQLQIALAGICKDTIESTSTKLIAQGYTDVTVKVKITVE
jgi:hypothetical protein